LLAAAAGALALYTNHTTTTYETDAGPGLIGAGELNRAEIRSLEQDVGCGIEGCELVATFSAAEPIDGCIVDGHRVTFEPDGTDAGFVLYQATDGDLRYEIHHSVSSPDAEPFESVNCYAG